jgi:AraC-like DNA-binding protein
MFLLLLIAGILLSVILIFNKGIRYQSKIYLGLFFMLVCLFFFDRHVQFVSNPQFSTEPVLFKPLCITILFYLTGPMLYWFVRSNITPNPRLKINDLWHLIPIIAVFLVIIHQTLFHNPDEFLSASNKLINRGNLIQYETSFLHGLGSGLFRYLSPPILILGYLFFSVAAFIHILTQWKSLPVLSRYHYIIISLGFLLGFLLLLIVGQALLLIYFQTEGSTVYHIRNLLRILSGLEFAGWFITPFLFPGILYKWQFLPESGNAVKGEMDSLCQEVSNNHNAFLGTEYLLLIGEKADCCMREIQPYLQADFSLAQLAVMIQIPVHHLACYFRKEKRQSFHDYRNEWRVNHAKELIKEGMADGITLEAIGYRSGFLNRNAFRNTFLKLEGILPSEFALKTKE